MPRVGVEAKIILYENVKSTGQEYTCLSGHFSSLLTNVYMLISGPLIGGVVGGLAVILVITVLVYIR